MTGNRPRRALARVGALLLDTLLPVVCPGCQREMPGRRWICGACRRRLRPVPRGWICFLCRSRLRPGGDREAGYACTDPEHRGWTGLAGFWMESPLDAFLHGLKYGSREDLARPLARILAPRLTALPGGGILTPVPLHPTRRRERGYNQAALLARTLAPRLGAPVVEGVVLRARYTPPQARLQTERRGGNVAGAFRVPEAAPVAARTWILVDDVVTTGSTLLEAAGALMDAGAERVIPVAVALA